MKLDWRTHEALITIGLANAYGYYTHNTNLKEQVGKLVEFSEEAEDTLQITSPESFRPVEGKVNWLFTMFEGEVIPEFYQKNLLQADFLIVPSFWVKKNFIQCGVTRPIFVVPHGVRPEFSYVERSLPKKGERFRFLAVGAPNNRKGWEEIDFAWKRLFKDNPSVELYLKTTGLKDIGDSVVTIGNVIIDGRNVPLEELVKIYHSAHCFLFPTRGEGFGLTLAEAMRTGLPCISPLYSGVTEFFDPSVGFAVDYMNADIEFSFPGLGNRKWWTRGGIPDMKALCDAMLYVPQHWEEAVEMGFRASQRISDRFTWEKSARLLYDILKREVKKRRGQHGSD